MVVGVVAASLRVPFDRTDVAASCRETKVFFLFVRSPLSADLWCLLACESRSCCQTKWHFVSLAALLTMSLLIGDGHVSLCASFVVALCRAARRAARCSLGAPTALLGWQEDFASTRVRCLSFVCAHCASANMVLARNCRGAVKIGRAHV